jgi:hypothetical protein
MTKAEILLNNQKRWGRQQYTRWREPSKLFDKIEIADATSIWFGLQGYIIGNRTDGCIAIYLPMTKSVGMSGALYYTQVKRI